MKTEFLKGLNITDQTIIDAIMAENGRDINNAKGNTEQLNTQIADLQKQLGERDEQLKGLKDSVKDNEKLTKQITELEEANKKATTEYQDKITEIQRNHAIENGVRDAKAKNIKAVTALLDMSKITFADDKLTGFTEQIEALKKDEATAFLFTEEQKNPPTPSGMNLNNPPAGSGGNPPTSGSFAEAIAKHIGGNK